jgi:hypothetical protein
MRVQQKMQAKLQAQYEQKMLQIDDNFLHIQSLSDKKPHILVAS